MKIAVAVLLITFIFVSCGTTESVSSEEAVSTTSITIPAPTKNGVPTALLLTSTSTVTEKEVIILQESAQLLCPPLQTAQISSPQIVVDGNVYQLICVFGAGHSTTINIKRFKSQIEAQTAFHNAALDHSVQDYHSHPSSTWEQPDLYHVGKERILVWQVDRWVIQINSVDDAELVSPGPSEVADVLYQTATKEGLFYK